MQQQWRYFANMIGALMSGVVAVAVIDAAVDRSDRDVNRRQSDVDGLHALFARVLEAEIEQRDFLRTADRRDRSLYTSSIDPRRQPLLSAAEHTTGIDDAAVAGVQQIGNSASVELRQFQDALDPRHSQGIEAPATIARFRSNWQLLAEVKSLIEKTLRSEREQVDRLRATQIPLQRFCMITGSSLATFIFALSAYSFVRVRRRTASCERDPARAWQRELLDIVLASTGDGVIVADCNARVVYLNPVAERLTGWTMQEARGLPSGHIFKTIEVKTLPALASLMEGGIGHADGVSPGAHTRLMCRNGTEILIDDRCSPVGHGNAPLQGVALVFRDFSSRQDAEQEVLSLTASLKEKISELETLFNEAPVGFAFAKDAKCETVQMNPYLANLLGMPVEEGATPLMQFCKPMAQYTVMRDGVELPTSQRPLQLAASTGKAAHDVELSIAFRGGKTITVFGSAVPLLGPDGQPRGAIGTFSDQTERKLAEAALLNSKDEAHAANAAKDIFLAKLSHELRTPLTPVATLLASWERDPALPVSMLADVQMMRRNVDLEARMIDDLLDLTRIVQNKVSLNPETTDVHELLNAVISIYRADMDAKQLTLNVQLDACCHHVRADPARFQQVLWNLLRNATKFTPAGGEINLRTADDADGNLLIHVRDNGIGMSAETVGKLFRPFEQGSAETVRRYGGLGLGLALSKALLDAQGGVISASSDGPHTGSTFTVSMPCTDAPQYKPIASLMTITPAGPTRSLHILLVEDHADTARVMSRLLKRCGHQVTTADSVAAATAAVDAGCFDLLLSDIGLPDGSGLDVIRHVRRTLSIPAIVISGYGMEHDIARCKAAGFDAHVTKPLNFQRLETIIAELSGQSAETPMAKVA